MLLELHGRRITAATVLSFLIIANLSACTLCRERWITFHQHELTISSSMAFDRLDQVRKIGVLHLFLLVDMVGICRARACTFLTENGG